MKASDTRPPRKKSHRYYNKHTLSWWRIIAVSIVLFITEANAAAFRNETSSENVTAKHEDTTKYYHESLIQSTLYVDEPATVTAVSNYLEDETTPTTNIDYNNHYGHISFNLIDSDENSIDGVPSDEDSTKYYYRYVKEKEVNVVEPEATTIISNITEVNSEIRQGKNIDENTTVNDVEITSTENEAEASETTTIEDYPFDDSEEYDSVTENKTTVMEPTIDMGPLNAFRDIATSLVESLVERIVPQGLRDIFRRMQNQNEQLETIRLRSREENGGLGQFGRSLLKNIAAPLNQLMQGVRDYGSLDSDRNFLTGVASGVASVADSVSDAFKDRVKAIYPGTLWCGDGHIGKAGDIGLFFMTDSCCRRHDSCKMYILAGETKYGLTNTGIFSRTHCECDKAFYRCLKKTNSLISNQVGVTFFSILGPQCFKREHPIIKCAKRTRITGQKCEEYLLDYSQPKMWQWFDNETF